MRKGGGKGKGRGRGEKSVQGGGSRGREEKGGKKEGRGEGKGERRWICSLLTQKKHQQLIENILLPILLLVCVNIKITFLPLPPYLPLTSPLLSPPSPPIHLFPAFHLSSSSPLLFPLYSHSSFLFRIPSAAFLFCIWPNWLNTAPQLNNAFALS